VGCIYMRNGINFFCVWKRRIYCTVCHFRFPVEASVSIILVHWHVCK
jgi:hypothetical protein